MICAHRSRSLTVHGSRHAWSRWVAAGCLLLLVLLVGDAGAADLRVVRSRHYTIHSDLEIPLLVDVGRRMDAMYDEYMRRLSDFELRDDKRPMDAFLFTYKEDYAIFTGGRHQNTGGVFLPGK